MIDSSDASPSKKKPRSATEDLFGDILLVKVESAKPVSSRAQEDVHQY